MANLCGLQIESFDIGNSPGAIDDAINFNSTLVAAMLDYNPQAPIARADAAHFHAREDLNADAPGFYA
jgi:hypothetical protein